MDDAGLLAHLRSWEGRTEVAEDLITAAPLRGLTATLDRDDPPPTVGTELPPLWHWLFFLPHPPASALGSDGHAARGGFLPPVPLPRRMWAGGRLAWHAPLRVGDAVRRRSRVASVTHKRGRSGDLVFVGVEHEVSGPSGLALTEAHDLVYRSDAGPASAGSAPDPTEAEAPWQRVVQPDDVLLFRYSALTFNGHRIHYDRRYATEVEGYPGLVVHGPLIATLLLDLVRRHLPRARVSGFSFRATRPAFDHRPLSLRGRPDPDGAAVALWASGPDGVPSMHARATLA